MPVKTHQDGPGSSPSHGWCIIWTAYQSGVASETYPMAPVRTSRGGPAPPTINITNQISRPSALRGTCCRDQTAEQQTHRGQAQRQVAEDRDDTQKRCWRLEVVDEAGRDQQYHRSRSLPGLQQRRTLAACFEDLDFTGELRSETARDHSSHSIIAAIFVADSDDDGIGTLRCHSRSMCSFRKWVAHEMQGS